MLWTVSCGIYYILLWSSIMPTTYLKVTTLAPRHLSSPIIYYFLMSNNAFLCQKMFSLLKQKLSLWLPLHFQVSRDYSKAYATLILVLGSVKRFATNQNITASKVESTVRYTRHNNCPHFFAILIFTDISIKIHRFVCIRQAYGLYDL